MEIDPVCGMEVDTATAKLTSEHGGKTYYFCAPGCKRTFDKNPAEFTKDGAGQTHGGHH